MALLAATAGAARRHGSLSAQETSGVQIPSAAGSGSPPAAGSRGAARPGSAPAVDGEAGPWQDLPSWAGDYPAGAAGRRRATQPPEPEPEPGPGLGGEGSLSVLAERAPPEGAALEDVTPSQDGGVLRWRLRRGDGARPRPYEGAGLAIHYVGRLAADRTCFDASVPTRDGNAAGGLPLRLTLGAGQVIRGWEVALRAMEWGEISLFRCRPEYAYGAEGFKGVIPPSATLDFYIQLIGWEPELRWCVRS